MADIIICPNYISHHGDRGHRRSTITCLPLMINGGFNMMEQHRFDNQDDMRAYLEQYCMSFDYKECPCYKAREGADKEEERMKTMAKKLKAANSHIKKLEGFLDLERSRNHSRNVEIARLKRQLDVAKGDLAGVGGALAARIGDDIEITQEELMDAPRYAATVIDGRIVLKRI